MVFVLRRTLWWSILKYVGYLLLRSRGDHWIGVVVFTTGMVFVLRFSLHWSVVILLICCCVTNLLLFYWSVVVLLICCCFTHAGVSTMMVLFLVCSQHWDGLVNLMVLLYCNVTYSLTYWNWDCITFHRLFC